MTFSLRFVAHSEVGRIRKNNQDAAYASPTMLLVADGMGGAAAGDLASAVAATEAARSDAATEIRQADGTEMLERIAGMIARSNSRLSDLIESNLELDGMGTTFCGALFNGRQFGLAHVGDSRGYLLRDGELLQLTHDHSWVQSLIDEGKITPEQAETHPHRSLILKVLNGQVHFEPDLDVHEARLGDKLMFCSDGLSGLVSDAEMAAVLAGDDLNEVTQQLAKLANDNGGHDNISIVIGEVVEHDEELDATAPLLVGSAVEIEIPRTNISTTPGTGGGYPSATEPDVVVEHSADEVARYAPTEEKRRWPGVIATILALALAAAGGWWATSAYVASRYFISADDGHVAVFNGLPGNVLSIELHDLVERTDIPVENLPRFYRGEVEASINVGDLDAAERTVGSLRELAENCVAIREERLEQFTNPPATPEPEDTTAPDDEPDGDGGDGGPGDQEPAEPEQTGPGLPLDPLLTITPQAPATARVPEFLQPFTPEPTPPDLVEELATLAPEPGEELDLEDC